MACENLEREVVIAMIHQVFPENSLLNQCPFLTMLLRLDLERPTIESERDKCSIIPSTLIRSHWRYGVQLWVHLKEDSAAVQRKPLFEIWSTIQ